jgi:hypothetical protein
MARCTSHCGQACCVPGGIYVVLCDRAAVLARGVGGLEANVVRLDVGAKTCTVVA